jgi:hypothetical protein
MQTTFKYTAPKPIAYRNCLFHSRAELKFVLSIEAEYRFLREHVTIWYNPKSNTPLAGHSVSYLPEGSRKYTPDFLVRHKETNQAFLVEIKPSAFNDETWLQEHKMLAENFIAQKGYDWQYKIVFDNEINLTKEQWEIFNAVTGNQRGFAMRCKMQEQEKKYNDYNVQYFKHVPSLDKQEELTREEYVRFVRLGVGTGNY